MQVTLQPPVDELKVIRDLEDLPLALGAFLAVLAVAAVGYAVTAAVIRRRRDLAVLRALGLTRRQTRLAVATQATVLALAGLLFGIPLGLALGRFLWRDAAGIAPLAYHPPLAVWALVLITPAAVLVVNLVAVWPQWRAIRMRAGHGSSAPSSPGTGCSAPGGCRSCSCHFPHEEAPGLLWDRIATFAGLTG